MSKEHQVTYTSEKTSASLLSQDNVVTVSLGRGFSTHAAMLDLCSS